MASVFTHPAVPIALALGLGNQVVPPRLLFAGILLSLLPDLDVILLYMGVPWSSVYGHRGFTHSLAFALICGVLMAICFRQRSMQSLIFGFCIVASHAVLDAMTWGGQGVALYWPLSNTRLHMPFQPLPASPMSIDSFMRWGGFVLRSELRIIWMPLLSSAAVVAAARWWLLPVLRRRQWIGSRPALGLNFIRTDRR